MSTEEAYNLDDIDQFLKIPEANLRVIFIDFRCKNAVNQLLLKDKRQFEISLMKMLIRHVEYSEAVCLCS